MRRSVRWLLGGAVLGSLVMQAWSQHQQRLLVRRARNSQVRVLIVGAGVVGSSYAAHLVREGLHVTLLARERRGQELRRSGLQVQDAITLRQQTAHLRVTTAVPPEEEYDLGIVAVRYTQVSGALDVVRPLADRTPLLILQNNPAGADLLAERLGERHVLMGFPATGGERVHDVVRSLPLWLKATVIGESDGADTQRLHQTAAILRGAGLRVRIERHIVPWLATHAAMVAVLAGCVYRNGGQVRRLARSVDETQLYLAGLREAIQILDANAIPITPPAQRALLQHSLQLQSAVMRMAGYIPWLPLVTDRHLAAAPEEMKALYDHLLGLATRAGVDAPVITSLGAHFPTIG